MTTTYDDSEQDVLADVFARMLRAATADGGNKRAAGTKPPWWRDPAHEAAIFSHLDKWKHGELVDPESGAHPLVHLAWRALAIAYQETYGKRDPALVSFAQETHDAIFKAGLEAMEATARPWAEVKEELGITTTDGKTDVTQTCTDWFKTWAGGNTRYCVLQEGHEGKHRDDLAFEWKQLSEVQGG